jgi:hypothetical protein
MTGREPPEIRGIPLVNPTTQELIYVVLQQLKFSEEAAKRGGFLVIDDYNHSYVQTMTTLHELIYERELNGNKIPDSIYVLLTANRLEDRSGAQPIPPTVATRVKHYTLEPSAEEWVDYALATGIHKTLVAFVERHPNLISGEPDEGGFDPASPQMAQPTPRTLELLSNELYLISDPNIRFIEAQAHIGPAAAETFQRFLKLEVDTPKPQEILRKLLITGKIDKQWMYNVSVLGYAVGHREIAVWDRVLQYILKLMTDSDVALALTMFRRLLNLDQAHLEKSNMDVKSTLISQCPTASKVIECEEFRHFARILHQVG